MPPKQMNTRMIKEALRYKFELDHSLERTAMALKISKGVVAKYVSLSKAAGLDWGQIQAMTEAQLHARLMPGRNGDGSHGQYSQIDFAHIHRELSRKGMTLMLLWQEHQADNAQAAPTNTPNTASTTGAGPRPSNAPCAKPTAQARSCSWTSPAPPWV